MDEIDAGNANVLIQVNAALSNGLCAFPDMMVKKHEDFVFIASANTYGNGANRQYVGRNQLDAATLDRFATIDWYVDEELEESLTFGINGKAWYMAVREVRKHIEEKKIRALVSPRATQKGCSLLSAGVQVDEVIRATLLASVPDDKKQDVITMATNVFNKFASDVPKQLPTEVDPPTAADLLKEDIDLSNVPF
jgi:MoxR-like ATPase